VCQLCRKYAAFSYASVLRHIGTVHAHEAGYNVTCGIEECPSKFTNHHAFRRHLKKKHPHVMVTQDPEPEELEFLHVQDDSEEEGSGISIATSLKTKEDKKAAAMFILKLKEKHQIAQTTVDEILQDTEQVTGKMVHRLHQQLTTVLTEAGVNADDVPGLAELFEDPEILHPFDGLHTEYRQNKFYSEKMGLVVGSSTDMTQLTSV